MVIVKEMSPLASIVDIMLALLEGFSTNPSTSLMAPYKPNPKSGFTKISVYNSRGFSSAGFAWVAL